MAKNKVICLDMAVCSSWGRRLPKHVFYTRAAAHRGHHYCLNCGMPKKQARDDQEPIENRIVDPYTLEPITVTNNSL